MVDRQSKIKVSQNLSPVFEESRRSRNSCRIFTQSFCFAYLFVCLFFEGQGGFAICELSSEGVLEVSRSNLKL